MSKQKGATYERKIVDILSNFWLKPFRRTPMSGGWGKSVFEDETAFDLVGSHDFPLHIEMRNRKRIEYADWMEESIESNNKLKKTKKKAALVFHQTQENTKKGKIRAGDFAMMELEDFVFIARKEVAKLIQEFVNRYKHYRENAKAFGTFIEGDRYELYIKDCREVTGDRHWKLKHHLSLLIGYSQTPRVEKEIIIPIIIANSKKKFDHTYIIIPLVPAFLDAMDRERFWVDDSAENIKT